MNKMIRNSSFPKMTKREIENFRSNICDVITGKMSKEDVVRFKKQSEQVDATYKEFLKSNNGKNPILGI